MRGDSDEKVLREDGEREHEQPHAGRQRRRMRSVRQSADMCVAGAPASTHTQPVQSITHPFLARSNSQPTGLFALPRTIDSARPEVMSIK